MKITYQFDTLRDSRIVAGICEKCGKKKKRTVSDSMTQNPYNKNDDGTVRTRTQIYEELRKRVEAKAEILKNRFICASCFSNLPYPQVWPPKETA